MKTEQIFLAFLTLTAAIGIPAIILRQLSLIIGTPSTILWTISMGILLTWLSIEHNRE